MNHGRHPILRLAPLAMAMSLYGATALAGDDASAAGDTINAPDQSAAPAKQSNTTAPATVHQADTLGVETTDADGISTEQGMPATPHQEQALREFSAADTDGDGQLSKDEYLAMQTSAGASDSTGATSGMDQGSVDQAAQEQQQYSDSLNANEQPGVDSQGPRDRAADSETEWGSAPQHADR